MGIRNVQRVDSVNMDKAFYDGNGFLIDSPIVTRSGIFEYMNADGSKRYEFRPPEEVMKIDSLTTYKGKPITIRHPKEMVTGTKPVRTIGSIVSDGIVDGDNVKAEIVIHDVSPLSGGRMRELSLGYLVDVEEVSGEHNGQRYDAIQRNIRINHLALVERGRAGNARLRLDAECNQIQDEREDEKLMKVRLDGIEYEAAPEVINALEKETKRADEAEQTIKKEQSNRDALQAKLDGADADLAKLKTELVEKDKAHKDSIASAVKSRVALEKTGTDFEVEKMDEMSDRQIKEAVIKAVRNDASADYADKSDDYIAAAFDMAVESRKDDTSRENRRKTNARSDGADDNKGAMTLDEIKEQARRDAQENWNKGDGQ